MTHALQAGKASHGGYQYQQQPRSALRQGSLQDQLDPDQAAFYGYPPAPQPPPYYPNQGLDNFVGMPMHPGMAQQHPAQATPFQVSAITIPALNMSAI